MNSLSRLFSSSIGKKIVMSLTGLFLCTFLAEHVAGNFLLFMNDGGAMYDAYTEFMSHNIVVRTIEIVLFASLLGHAFSGVLVWIKNRRSRPENYKVYKLRENTPLSSRITMLTGSFIFLFLVVHLRTFFVPTRFATENVSPYALVAQAFSNRWYSAFYLVALILLSYHLRHGFQSAFQTLGLKNKKYSNVLDWIAVIFWLLIPLGFASMPIYFALFHRAGPPAMVLGVH
ncbi:MAG TPA: succinate dehydrogenase cytochrome b subunit [Bacteroidota bacterium]|nr:succinate dehydrogenase cytochrome b subunit [Bacteroidota bacterium]